MEFTGRDYELLAFIIGVPLVLIVGGLYLLFGPKRDLLGRPVQDDPPDSTR